MTKSKKFFFYGLMFHYFHDNKMFPKSQGTISKNHFIKIIKSVGRKNILDADVFFKKLISKKLKKTDSCITFDDGLLSQYKIALPVLTKLKIKAFWFIQSSILNPRPNSLEIYRHFRNTKFRNINEFYDVFFWNILSITNKHCLNSIELFFNILDKLEMRLEPIKIGYLSVFVFTISLNCFINIYNFLNYLIF